MAVLGRSGVHLPDVERAIQQEVCKRNYLARYQLRVAEAERATETDTLRRLEAKYRAPASQAGDADAITVDVIAQELPSPVIERMPVQASLFRIPITIQANPPILGR